MRLAGTITPDTNSRCNVTIGTILSSWLPGTTGAAGTMTSARRPQRVVLASVTPTTPASNTYTASACRCWWSRPGRHGVTFPARPARGARFSPTSTISAAFSTSPSGRWGKTKRPLAKFRPTTTTPTSWRPTLCFPAVPNVRNQGRSTTFSLTSAASREPSPTSSAPSTRRATSWTRQPISQAIRRTRTMMPLRVNNSTAPPVPASRVGPASAGAFTLLRRYTGRPASGATRQRRHLIGSKPLLPAFLFALTFIAIGLFATNAWAGPKYKVLHGFTGGSDGGGLWGTLTLDGHGNLYGTTVETVFELEPYSDGKWSLKILHRFSNKDGEGNGGLVLDAVGNVYGGT